VEQGEPDNLDVYLGMTAQDLVRLVLCLLIEEAMNKHLDGFRDEPAERAPRSGLILEPRFIPPGIGMNLRHDAAVQSFKVEHNKVAHPVMVPP
jgi:hypothetical protein